MPPTGPPYPPEFRAEAVRLVRTSGKTQKEIAADLGVSTDALRKWVRQAQIDAGEREGLTTAERDELQRLRRETSGRASDPEKAAAFFVRETDRTR